MKKRTLVVLLIMAVITALCFSGCSKEPMTLEKYVQDNFVWTDNMEIIAQKLQKVSKVLNGTLETELADKILAGVI